MKLKCVIAAKFLDYVKIEIRKTKRKAGKVQGFALRAQ
jgi:hypothetical protein